MMREIDKSIVGKTFGYLKVVDIIRNNSKLYCECICNCGKTVFISKGNITNNHTLSCGCKKKKTLEEKLGKLIGKKFGKLTVLEEVIKENRKIYCKCKCECGNLKDVKRDLLINGKITHCDNCKLKYSHLKGVKIGYLTILDIEKSKKRVYCKCKCECGKIINIVLKEILNNTVFSCGCKLTSTDKEIIGKQYGDLTVLSANVKDGKVYYSCKCVCSNVIDLTKRQLNNKKFHKHCGCKFIGEKYGKLVIKKAKRINKRIMCDCKCECGNSVSVSYSNLISGHSTSCGCLSRNSQYDNIIGRRFGKLIVINELNKHDKNGHKHYLCKCDCGNTIEVTGNNLIWEQTKSCGCLRKVKSLQKKKAVNNVSGKKGVYRDRYSGKWVASVGLNNRKHKKYTYNFNEAVEKRAELEREYYLPIINKYQ